MIPSNLFWLQFHTVVKKLIISDISEINSSTCETNIPSPAPKKSSDCTSPAVLALADTLRTVCWCCWADFRASDRPLRMLLAVRSPVHIIIGLCWGKKYIFRMIYITSKLLHSVQNDRNDTRCPIEKWYPFLNLYYF